MDNHIDPTAEQFQVFKQLPRDVPIMMLNLVRFKELASYDGDNTVSGRDAYIRYGDLSNPILSRVGGEVIWRGIPENVLIGPSHEQWDVAFIARYPEANAFLAMITDPDYRLAVVHRQAAVLDSRLIRMGDSLLGEGFAG